MHDLRARDFDGDRRQARTSRPRGGVGTAAHRLAATRSISHGGVAGGAASWARRKATAGTTTTHAAAQRAAAMIARGPRRSLGGGSAAVNVKSMRKDPCAMRRRRSERDRLARLGLVRRTSSLVRRASPRSPTESRLRTLAEDARANATLQLSFRRRRRRRRHQPVARRRIARAGAPTTGARACRSSELELDVRASHDAPPLGEGIIVRWPRAEGSTGGGGRSSTGFSRTPRDVDARRAPALKTLPRMPSRPRSPGSRALTPNPRDKPRARSSRARRRPARPRRRRRLRRLDFGARRTRGVDRLGPRLAPPQIHVRSSGIPARSEVRGHRRAARWSARRRWAAFGSSTHPASARVAGDIAAEAEEPSGAQREPGVCRGRVATGDYERRATRCRASRAPSVYTMTTRLPGEGTLTLAPTEYA